MNWEQLINNIYNKPADLQTVAGTFAKQLAMDYDAVVQQKKISDCAITVPHLNTVTDKQTYLAHTVAFLLYPYNKPTEVETNLSIGVDIEKVTDKIGAYICYRRLITGLRRAYRAQISPTPKQKPPLTRYQKARLHGPRDDYHRIKQDDSISDAIINPIPMSVCVSPLAELQPFFSFLKYEKMEPMLDQKALSFTRGTQFTDGRMDLCKQVVGPTWINALMDSIQNNQQIQHFLLGNNVIGLTGAKAIVKFLSKKNRPKIKTWYLAGNNLEATSIKLIAQKLNTDPAVQGLWLKRNPIGPEGALHLGNMLRNNQNIEILDLHNTAIFDQGVRYIFEGLQYNQSMDSLYLDANSITEQGAYTIAEYFNNLTKQNRKGLSTLYLSINRLGDSGVIALARSLANYPYLKRLCLGSNRIEVQGAQIVLEALVHHPTLLYLDLGLYKSTSDMGELPNNIGDKGIPVLCNFLRENKRLQVFSLRDNNIGLAGIERLAEALQANHTLLKFEYEQFGLKIPNHIHQYIRTKLEENIARTLGISWQVFQNDHARYIKHDKVVRNIDSIYRNKSCALK